MKLIKGISIFFGCLCFSSIQAQDLNKYLCKKFLESDKLYLIKSELATRNLETSYGEVFTFEELVKENWPEKEIISISEKDYSQLPDKKNAFHILLVNLSKTRIGSTSTLGNYSYDGIQIKQGSVDKLVKSKYLYFMSVNLSEVSEGILAERLIYSTENLRDLLKNYNEKSYRSSYYYKVGNYKDYLASHTLFLRESELYENKLNTVSSIKKLYPYKFKLVNDEEWMEALVQKKEKIIYLEHLGSASSREVDVRTTDGKLLITSFGWIPPIRLSKRNFKKLFSD